MGWRREREGSVGSEPRPAEARELVPGGGGDDWERSGEEGPPAHVARNPESLSLWYLTPVSGE